jgi:hypothetical protein
LSDDEAVIEDVVRTFFSAFVSGPECIARLAALRELFVPGALVVRTCGMDPAVYSVDEFIAPREELLTSGKLADFKEWAEDGRIDVFGDIAHWFGGYAKAGLQDGTPYAGRGMKSIQFVRTPEGWRITAAAWDDERRGVSR